MSRDQIVLVEGAIARVPSQTALGGEKINAKKDECNDVNIVFFSCEDMDLLSKDCRTMYVQHWNGMRPGSYKSRQTTCTVYDNVRAALELRALDFQRKIKTHTMMLPMMRH